MLDKFSNQILTIFSSAFPLSMIDPNISSYFFPLKPCSSHYYESPQSDGAYEGGRSYRRRCWRNYCWRRHVDVARVQKTYYYVLDDFSLFNFDPWIFKNLFLIMKHFSCISVCERSIFIISYRQSSPTLIFS